MKLTASIIIPTRGRFDMLQRGVRAVISQLTAGDEIVIVENGPPSRETKTWVKNLRSRSTRILYAHEPRLGPSYARNTGIALAKGHILVFLDDDCVPSKNWLRTMKAHHT